MATVSMMSTLGRDGEDIVYDSEEDRDLVLVIPDSTPSAATVVSQHNFAPDLSISSFTAKCANTASDALSIPTSSISARHSRPRPRPAYKGSAIDTSTSINGSSLNTVHSTKTPLGNIQPTIIESESTSSLACDITHPHPRTTSISAPIHFQGNNTNHPDIIELTSDGSDDDELLLLRPCKRRPVKTQSKTAPPASSHRILSLPPSSIPGSASYPVILHPNSGAVTSSSPNAIKRKHSPPLFFTSSQSNTEIIGTLSGVASVDPEPRPARKKAKRTARKVDAKASKQSKGVAKAKATSNAPPRKTTSTKPSHVGVVLDRFPTVERAMYKSAEFIDDEDDDDEEISVPPRSAQHEDSSSVQQARGSGAPVGIQTTENLPGGRGTVESNPRKFDGRVDSDVEMPAAPSKTRGRKKVVLDSDDENVDDVEPDTVFANKGGKEMGNGKDKGKGSGRKTIKGTTDAREKRGQESMRKVPAEPEITPRPEIEQDVAIKENVPPPPQPNPPKPPTTVATSKTPVRSHTISNTRTPMSELLRRVNSYSNSMSTTPNVSRSPVVSSTATAYSPLLKSSRSLLSRIAPLHPNRKPPPPPLPKPPPPKKSKKQLALEEKWEEELSESVEGWAALDEKERSELRKAKWTMEMGGCDD